MVEETAKEYANFFYNMDLKKELNPLSKGITEMLARLDEFENLLTIVKKDSNEIIKQNVPKIIKFKPEFDKICERIDALDNFVEIINNDLNKLEEKVEIAEEELNIKDYSSSIKSLFKPFLRKAKLETESNKSNIDENGVYIKPILFKCDDFFGDEEEK